MTFPGCVLSAILTGLPSRTTEPPKGNTMGIDDLKKYADKAKDAVSDNRDKIEGAADSAIDKVAKGDKGEKAKGAVRSGLDKLTGE